MMLSGKSALVPGGAAVFGAGIADRVATKGKKGLIADRTLDPVAQANRAADFGQEGAT